MATLNVAHRKMTGLPSHIDDIQALEESLHRPEIRRSREAVEALLADGFTEFGSSGTLYRRAEIIDLLTEEEEAADDGSLHTSDYALTPISPDAVLLTYRTQHTAGDGSERHVLRSSIWIKDGQKWRMLFHQGTVTTPLT